MSPCRKRAGDRESRDESTTHLRTSSELKDHSMSRIFDASGHYSRDSLAPRIAEPVSLRVVGMSKHGTVTDVAPSMKPACGLFTMFQGDHDLPVQPATTETLPTRPTSDTATTSPSKDLDQNYKVNSLQIPRDLSAMYLNESHEASGSITPLSDAKDHASLEINPSDSIAEPASDGQRNFQAKRPRSSTDGSFKSTQSKHSVASLGSLGSLFLNRSPRDSMQGSLHRTMDTSTWSSGKQTTFSEEMPGPMLQPLDEELHFSRKQESFWNRYILRLGKKNLLEWTMHPALLWDYAAQGNVEGVRSVLSFGNVDVNCPDQYGWTALLTASSHGYADIVELLLQRKDIDVEFQDTQGSTALSWAATNGHLKVVQLLLASGKVENHRENGSGCAALTWATMKGHNEIVSLLMKGLYSEEDMAQDGWWSVVDEKNCLGVGMI